MANIPQLTAQEVEKLEISARVELWELDLRRNGGNLLRFCNQPNEKQQPVVWKGQTYQTYPIQGEGFSFKTEGAMDRPTLVVANLHGLVTSALAQDDFLIGATVTRRLVHAKFLDAVNFTNGNPYANPQQEVVQYFILERVVSLTHEFATFELTIPSETTGARLPNRRVIANLCVWQYRKGACTYSGGACADENDRPTNDINQDKCGKRLSSCRMRFGNEPLPFGGFPAADKVNNQ